MSQPLSHLEANVPYDVGTVLQFPVSSAELNFPSTIAASGNASSGVVLTNGFKSFAFAATLSTAASISIQRYLDPAGTIPQGAALTATTAAGAQGLINSTDGVPFQSMKITINNTGVSTGNLSNTYLLLQSN